MVYNKYQLGTELILNNKIIVYKGYEIKRNFVKKAFQVTKDNTIKYFKETGKILDYIEGESMTAKVSITKERYGGNHSYSLRIKSNKNVFTVDNIWTKKDLLKILQEKTKVTKEYLDNLDFRKTFIEFEINLV